MALDDGLRSLLTDEDSVEELDEAVETTSPPRARTSLPRTRVNISPQAFFVVNMLLFFTVCLLSLVFLLLTGRIVPG